MKVSLEFPDTVSLMQFNHEYLQQVLVVTLYHLGKLSEYEACIALGVTRRTFEDLLPRFGFSVLADDQATINVEIHA